MTKMLGTEDLRVCLRALAYKSHILPFERLFPEEMLWCLPLCECEVDVNCKCYEGYYGEQRVEFGLWTQVPEEMLHHETYRDINPGWLPVPVIVPL